MKAFIYFSLDVTESVELSDDKLKSATPERRLEILEQAVADAMNLYRPTAMFDCQGDCNCPTPIEYYHDECLVKTGKLVCEECGPDVLTDFRRGQS